MPNDNLVDKGESTLRGMIDKEKENARIKLSRRKTRKKNTHTQSVFYLELFLLILMYIYTYFALRNGQSILTLLANSNLLIMKLNNGIPSKSFLREEDIEHHHAMFFFFKDEQKLCLKK